MDDKDLADRYSKLREETGMSIVQFARKIGCNPKTISFYENGTREMPRNVLLKYAEYFDVPADYLIGLTGDPNLKPSAVDELGLSPYTVSILSSKKGIKDITASDIINGIVESEYFNNLFIDILQAAQNKYDASKFPNISSWDDLSDFQKQLSTENYKANKKGGTVIPLEDSVSFFKMQVMAYFGTMIESIVNSCADKINSPRFKEAEWNDKENG